MNETHRTILTLFLIVSLLAVYSQAAPSNWAGWRGPNMSGISPDGNPPVKWSETENVKWKVELTGDGSDSSPIVWGDKIIFQTAVETDKKGEPAPQPASNSGRGGQEQTAASSSNYYQFNVVCLDRNTGKLIWEKMVCEAVPHQKHRAEHGYASFTPVTDGNFIWANFGSQGVYCLDMQGAVKWKKDLGKRNIRASFGEAGTLSIAGDKVIILNDHEDGSFIIALNKQTGQEVWKKTRDEGTTWTPPFVVEAGGKTQIVVVATKQTISYDATNGEVIWHCGGQTQNTIPSPVQGFGMVFCTSGFRGAKLQAIKLDSTGDLNGTDAVVWEVNEATPYVPSPLLYGERLYVLSGNNAILSCYNAKTGKPYYIKQTLAEMKGVYASPSAAADRVYLTGRNGVTVVLNNSDTLEVLATNKLDDGIDCSPAIVGDAIYLKGKQYLYCIAESKK